MKPSNVTDVISPVASPDGNLVCKCSFIFPVVHAFEFMLDMFCGRLTGSLAGKNIASTWKSDN